MQKIAFGTLGEQRATQFLKEKKYQILQNNYENVLGEIDIIAKDDKYVVFVEVKTRTSSAFGRASEAVGVAKRRKLRQVALLYMKKNKLLDSSVRFDVIEVYEDEINHIENAF